MKYKRTSLLVDAEKYEVGKGMEDGFERWSDVVTKGWIVTDSLVKVKRDNGEVMCPYISHRRGRTFISNGDYIILDEDGTKHVCGEDKMDTRFQRL